MAPPEGSGAAPERRERLRRTGLLLALGMRIGLLLMIEWIMQLTEPFLHVLGKGFSGRDLILLAGGFFLLAKSTKEIHGRRWMPWLQR